jgi:hypothetical protein
MQDFIAFVAAVATNWLTLMGVITLVLSFFERVRRNAPTWLWIAVAATLVFVASFQAWHEQLAVVRRAPPPEAAVADRRLVLPRVDELFGRRLQSTPNINGAFVSTAATGSKRIQLLIQVLGPKPHLPEEVASTIAHRIDETRRLGVPIKYDPVLVFNSEAPAPGFLEGVLRRNDVFAELGVDQFVRPRYLDQRNNVGADVLIVDRKHLLIALNTVPAAQSMQVGFLFTDQPALAEEFSDWFDQIVMPQTKPFDEWMAARAPKRK